MPFVHNKFFQDEFQGSKIRASLLGEEIPDEHVEGDHIYQYNRKESPSRYTYEPYRPPLDRQGQLLDEAMCEDPDENRQQLEKPSASLDSATQRLPGTLAQPRSLTRLGD